MVKIKIVIGLVVLIAIAVCSLSYYLYHQKEKKFSDLPTTQQKMINAFIANKGLAFTLENKIRIPDANDLKKDSSKDSDQLSLEINTKINGNLIPGGAVEGVYQIDGEDQSAFVKSEDKIFVKAKESNQWEQDNNSFVYETNILSRPEFIQIQKRLDNKKIDNKTYLQYEIIFEKPDQEIIKSLSQDQLESLRIYGTVSIDPATFQLKELNIHKGKAVSSADTVLTFSVLNEAPKIEVPQF